MRSFLYGLAVLIIPGLSGTVAADPEKSYQAGKKLAETVTGTKNDVDDRDAEARLNDWLRKKGEEHGKALQDAQKKKATSNK